MSNAFSAIALLVNKVITFALLFFLAKLLGVSKYGAFSYYYVIITGVASVVGEGVAIALSRYNMLQGVKVGQRLLLSVAFIAAVVAGVFGFGAVLFFPYQGGEGISLLSIPWWGFMFAFSTVLNIAITGLMFSVGSTRLWPVVQIAQGILGFALGGAVAMSQVAVTTILAVLSFVPLLVPTYGAWTILRASKAEVGAPVTLLALKKYMRESGVLALCGTMLLGSPVHVICLIIFGKFTLVSEEVGYFNLYFLFYVLITVVPASLSPYLVVRLMRSGLGQSSSYLMVGALAAVVLPVALYFARDIWLCWFGVHICVREDLLPLALGAGGLGLIITQLVQVLHSEHQSRHVLVAALLYAIVYLVVVAMYAIRGDMTANEQFIAFASALIVQVFVLGWCRFFVRTARRSKGDLIDAGVNAEIKAGDKQ